MFAQVTLVLILIRHRIKDPADSGEPGPHSEDLAMSIPYVSFNFMTTNRVIREWEMHAEAFFLEQAETALRASPQRSGEGRPLSRPPGPRAQAQVPEIFPDFGPRDPFKWVRGGIPRPGSRVTSRDRPRGPVSWIFGISGVVWGDFLLVLGNLY